MPQFDVSLGLWMPRGARGPAWTCTDSGAATAPSGHQTHRSKRAELGLDVGIVMVALYCRVRYVGKVAAGHEHRQFGASEVCIRSGVLSSRWTPLPVTAPAVCHLSTVDGSEGEPGTPGVRSIKLPLVERAARAWCARSACCPSDQVVDVHDLA